MSSSRKEILKWHGHRGQRADPKWENPIQTFRSDDAVRADQGNNISADEYQDKPQVLTAKVAILAQLVREAKCTVVYSGAGLSRSSGIPDYASKSHSGSAPKIRNNLDAGPTQAHWTLAAMERQGYVHHYVQQNHDGLPQKAGFPQEKMNEIHGAWFDPSNPVVKFSGDLRGDLFDAMLDLENKADLCLCLGTSLSGMNADRVAETPARRSFERKSNVLGTVIINLQRTRLDKVACLRIWAPLDVVFSMLARELSLEVDTTPPPLAPMVCMVPYGADGLPCSSDELMRLDLSIGRRLRISIPEASNADQIMTVARHGQDGSVGLRFQNVCGVHCLLGNWWIQSARRGKIGRLPLVNVDPAFSTAVPDEASPTSSACEFQIIQSHEATKSSSANCHRWSLQLDSIGCQIVEKVQWELHPTFRPPTEMLTEAPFRIQRYGWGTFRIKAWMKLKDEYGGSEVRAVHDLSFIEDGPIVHSTKVTVPGA